MRTSDIDWGEQLIQVQRKGSRAAQWLPTSAEAFMWLRLYVEEIVEPESPNNFVWQTQRAAAATRARNWNRPPMNHQALRAVLRRANTVAAKALRGRARQAGAFLHPTTCEKCHRGPAAMCDQVWLLSAVTVAFFGIAPRFTPVRGTCWSGSSPCT